MTCDVFVSYAHRDNLNPEGIGFVSRLKKFVEMQAATKYGHDVSVWWDEDLASGTQWKEAILAQLRTCRIFMPIFSPSWSNSRWAGQEWQAVWKRVNDDKGLGYQTRIIPVAFELSKGFTSSLPPEQASLQVRRRFASAMSDEAFRKEADALSGDISNLLKKLDGLNQADDTITNQQLT